MYKHDDIQGKYGGKPTLVICPKCNQPGFHDAWPWILSTRDTYATQLLLKGNLFKYACPVCGEVSTIAYDCLYHDFERRTLALYSSGEYAEQHCRQALERTAARAQQKSDMPETPYQRRLVFRPFQLCEKARIWHDGFDDRVIELMKVALKRGMLREGIIGRSDVLIYERNTDNGISFIVSGEMPGDVVGVPRGYEFLEKLLHESETSLENEFHFDSTWADGFLP